MYVYTEMIHFTVQQKLTQRCKATIHNKKINKIIPTQFNPIQGMNWKTQFSGPKGELDEVTEPWASE